MRKYRLISKRGEGTFSEVIKAQNTKTGTFHAIKCMKSCYKSADQVRSSLPFKTLQRLLNPKSVAIWSSIKNTSVCNTFHFLLCPYTARSTTSEKSKLSKGLLPTQILWSWRRSYLILPRDVLLLCLSCWKETSTSWWKVRPSMHRHQQNCYIRPDYSYNIINNIHSCQIVTNTSVNQLWRLSWDKYSLL